MKFQEGDKVKVVKKMHPWRLSAKRNYLNNIGVVLQRVYVSKSASVPNGVIIIVEFPSGRKERFPTQYLRKVLTDTEKSVRDIV